MPDEPHAAGGSSSIAAWWAVLGTAAVFAQAVVQLGSRGLRLVAEGLAPVEWLALGLLTVTFVWFEGVQALERRWVPFLVERAVRLRRERRLLPRLLAPLYATGMIAAPRGLLLRAWTGVAAIVAAVLLVRLLPEPWRGMIDFAVAAALAWALAAILLRSWRSLR